MQDNTKSSMEFTEFSTRRFKTVDKNAVLQVKSRIHNKIAIQLNFSFPQGILQKQYIRESGPFCKLNLQISLYTTNARIGKLIVKVIAMLMNYSVHNTGLFTRAGYVVINCLFIKLINAHKTSVAFFIKSRQSCI